MGPIRTILTGIVSLFGIRKTLSGNLALDAAQICRTDQCPMPLVYRRARIVGKAHAVASSGPGLDEFTGEPDGVLGFQPWRPTPGSEGYLGGLQRGKTGRVARYCLKAGSTTQESSPASDPPAPPLLIPIRRCERNEGRGGRRLGRSRVNRLTKQATLKREIAGWGGRIRTYDTQYQKLLPYHLATPQQRRCSYSNLGRPASEKRARRRAILRGCQG
jgi:hypothetical protein